VDITVGKKKLSLKRYKNKKPGFITSIQTRRGITGTTSQRYDKYGKQFNN